MKYLPYEDFEIHSDLTSDEVFYKLRAAVDTQGKWLIFTNKLFWGEVDRHYFRIWLVNMGKQNFTPFVFGKIQPKESGCCIRIRMRMPWFGFLFYTLFLVWLWIGYFKSIADLVIQKIQTGMWGIESPLQLLPAIGMFAFGYLLSVGIFKYDANYIKKYFLWLSQTSTENIKYKDQIFGLSESQIIVSVLVLTFIVSFGWIIFNLY
jgi:hypothetical protein